jgi:hypothetical protein
MGANVRFREKVLEKRFKFFTLVNESFNISRGGSSTSILFEGMALFDRSI